MPTGIDPQKWEKILNKVGQMLVIEAKRRCPVDDGTLRNSLQYEIRNGVIYIFSDLEYAPYVEYGTGEFHIDEEGNPLPHQGWDVVPVNKKALRFEPDRKERLAEGGNPDYVFAKKVHIKGAHAQPFIRPAIHQNEGTIIKIVSEGLVE